MKRAFHSFLASALPLFFLLCAWTPAHAAALFFSAPSNVSVGEIVPVEVKIDTIEKGFNAAEATIHFPTDIFEVVSLDATPASTVFNFWLNLPSFSNAQGTVSFSGGTTQGIIGSSIKVLQINFRVKGSGEALVTASDGSVNASDGSGTNILDTIKVAKFTASPASLYVSPEPEKKPAEAPTQEEQKAQESSAAGFSLFSKLPLHTPVIREARRVVSEAGGTDIFVAGSAEDGTHVHLKLRRGDTGVEEIIALVDESRTWKGIFYGIFADGVYYIEAVAEDMENRPSDIVVSERVPLYPPYTLVIRDIGIPWYFCAGALVVALAAAVGAVLLRRRAVFSPDSFLTRKTFFFAVALFLVASVAMFLLLWEGFKPEAIYWRGTTIQCLQHGHINIINHIHAKLEIFIDKTKQNIPADIGIVPGCMAEIHTHDDSGTIHIETVEADTVMTLADFFTVGGETLEKGGYALKVTVNGENHTDDINSYAIKDGDTISMSYTKITVPIRR